MTSRSAHVPADDPLVDALLASQERLHFFPPIGPRPVPVVVGVSGGLDSVCLLHILLHIAPQLQLDLHVAHVDHQLRPESASDAAFVADLARAWQVPVVQTALDPAELRADAAGLEAAARTARYAFLCATAMNVAGEDQVPIVAVAHHADDQAETLLLRLIQGAGIHGLAAMRPVTTLTVTASDGTSRAVRLVRPFLDVRRDDIAAYAQRHDLSWRDDATNRQLDRTRNRLRHTVLPLLAELNPRIVETLTRTAVLLADEAQRLQQLDTAQLQALLAQPLDNERVLLDLTRWQALAPAERRGVARAALLHLNRELREVGFERLESLAQQGDAARARGPHPLAARCAWTITPAIAGGPLCLSIHRADALPVYPTGPWLDMSWRKETVAARLPATGTLAIDGWTLHCRELAANELPEDWNRNEDRWRVLLDAGKAAEIHLTAPEVGLKLEPLGLPGHHKAVGDLFTDAKVPRCLRPGWPIVMDLSTQRPLWICGLAQDHSTRVTMETRRVRELVWRRVRESRSPAAL